MLDLCGIQWVETMVALLLGHLRCHPENVSLRCHLLCTLHSEEKLSPPTEEEGVHPLHSETRSRGASAIGISSGLPTLPIRLPSLHHTFSHWTHCISYGQRPGHTFLCVCWVASRRQRTVQLHPVDDDDTLFWAG